jgi:hypothetical protein
MLNTTNKTTKAPTPPTEAVHQQTRIKSFNSDTKGKLPNPYLHFMHINSINRNTTQRMFYQHNSMLPNTLTKKSKNLPTTHITSITTQTKALISSTKPDCTRKKEEEMKALP